MKNEITTIDGKFYQKAYPVLVPATNTRDFSPIGKYADTNKLVFNNGKDMPRGVFHHMYILSDEEIKEGDWVLINSKYVRQVNKIENEKYFTVHGNNAIFIISAKKIIASTDRALKFRTYQGNCGHYITHEPPRPSNEFLKAFCEKGGMNEVLIEMSQQCEQVFCSSTYPLSVQCIHPSRCSISNFKLKVAPDNTITIKPVKENKESILLTALQRIIDWDLPKTDLFWDEEKIKPMGYEAAYGSEGAKRFIKFIAIEAINKYANTK